MTGHFKLAAVAAVYAYDAVWIAISPPPFSDAFWVAFATGIPATIAATGAMWIGLRNSAKTDVVIGHVNSAATKAAGEIAALTQEIGLMREQAAEKKQTAALLAQAVAISTAPVAAPESTPIESNVATNRGIDQ